MKKHFEKSAGVCLLFAGICFAGSTTATAQEQTAGMNQPPKVLVIMREFLKPGKGGSMHQKSESAFVQAFTDAKWPEHYMGMDSLSGKSRALFFVGYDSFADWEKDYQAAMQNPTLSSALDSAEASDGELLDSYDQGVFTYSEDLSLRAPVKLPDMRYVEITVFDIRPGHRHDWSDLVKLYKQAWSKVPDAHWATFEEQYGNNGGRYIVVSPLKSLAEVDQEMIDDKKMGTALSADDKKKMDDLSASAIEAEQTNLFALDPKMSYVSDSWKASSPDFWGKK